MRRMKRTFGWRTLCTKCAVLVFQMLNCCIERRRFTKTRNESNKSIAPEGSVRKSQSNRENTTRRTSEGRVSPLAKRMGSESDFSTSSNDDDEFFEAVESQGDSGSSEKTLEDTLLTEVPQREGTLEQCGNLTLLATGEPLSIPITQVRRDWGPVTNVHDVTTWRIFLWRRNTTDLSWVSLLTPVFFHLVASKLS